MGSGGRTPASSPPRGDCSVVVVAVGDGDNVWTVDRVMGGPNPIKCTVSAWVAWAVRFDRRAGVVARLR